MVSKLDSQTYTSEFESHWVPHLFGLLLNRSKDLRKLLFLSLVPGGFFFFFSGTVNAGRY